MEKSIDDEFEISEIESRCEVGSGLENAVRFPLLEKLVLSELEFEYFVKDVFKIGKIS